MEAEPGNNSGKRPRRYFFIAFLFLFVLALLWSIDVSFIYFSLGGAVYFIFLGIRNSSPVGIRSAKADSSQSQYNLAALRDTWKKIFSPGGRGKYKPANKHKTVAKKFVIVATAFIGFLFALIIIVAVFSEDHFSDASYYFNQGEGHYWEGRYDSAYWYYKKALREDPEYAEALVGYGNVLVIRNMKDSALMMYDQAIESNPDYSVAHYNRCWWYYNQRDYNQSILELKLFLSGFPEYYDAMQLLGDNYYAKSQYDSALQWYDQAYQNNLRSRWLCHVMAYIYDTKGNTGKAIELYKEALKYDNSITDIYRRLGELIPGEEGNGYRTRALEMQ
jgi:tetratricopeptide (TPR) repeat protein